MYLCTLCILLHSNNLWVLGPGKPGHYSRVAICYKLTLAFTEASRVPALQIEHIYTRPMTSLELWSLTQSYLDLTFNYVALPVRRCIAQSNGRRLTCLREDSQRFSMRANYFIA